MKYIKYLLPILVICLTIGYAATNVTLSINGDAFIASDIDDFDVYFSYVDDYNYSDGISLLKSSTTLYFPDPGTPFNSPGETVIFNYEVTNASFAFDALISIDCDDEMLDGLEFVHVNEGKIVRARESLQGTLEFSHSGLGMWDLTGTCKLTATPIERNQLGEGAVGDKLVNDLEFRFIDNDEDNTYSVGDEVVINGETFYIAFVSPNCLELIAKYNIGPNFRQSSSTNYVSIMDEPRLLPTVNGIRHFDVTSHVGDAKDLFLGYQAFLDSIIGFNYESMYLPDYENLDAYGCTGLNANSGSCVNDEFPYLFNDQAFWTSSYSDYGVMYIDESGLVDSSFSAKAGVRPVIKITSEIFSELLVPRQELMLSHTDTDSDGTLSVGDVININGEEFYVAFYFLGGDFVELIAKYNIGPSGNQSVSPYYVNVIDDLSLLPSRGSGSFDMSYLSSDARFLMNEYSSFFHRIIGFEFIDVYLPNSENLTAYGCNIGDPSFSTCKTDSFEYLVNGQRFWTYSYTGGKVYYVDEDGDYSNSDSVLAGIRPILTVKFNYLEEVLGY